MFKTKPSDTKKTFNEVRDSDDRTFNIRSFFVKKLDFRTFVCWRCERHDPYRVFLFDQL